MQTFFYYLATLVESALSLVGIRAAYEAPAYALVRRLDGEVEIRDYAPRTVIETGTRGPGDAEAFRRLFRTITGGNRGARLIAMTVPVEQAERPAAPASPGTAGEGSMRFVLPRKVVAAGAPEPTDPQVRLVHLPPQRLAVLRFSGAADARTRRVREEALLRSLAAAGLAPRGAPVLLSYDPPMTPPFLRRNEVAVEVASAS
ncbi:SOUL family heme-binding protein [Methylobacterium sp. WSM2598]|uniref:SOUL family heme-binding protein n=1 Tax=Methylobacterium sp. WSM2598 TaxID=398261 RepID=UPI000380ABF7|nr:heme-binding protein [Methylobacterium sp. WSM2598]